MKIRVTQAKFAIESKDNEDIKELEALGFTIKENGPYVKVEDQFIEIDTLEDLLAYLHKVDFNLLLQHDEKFNWETKTWEHVGYCITIANDYLD